MIHNIEIPTHLISDFLLGSASTPFVCKNTNSYKIGDTVIFSNDKLISQYRFHVNSVIFDFNAPEALKSGYCILSLVYLR